MNSPAELFEHFTHGTSPGFTQEIGPVQNEVLSSGSASPVSGSLHGGPSKRIAQTARLHWALNTERYR